MKTVFFVILAVMLCLQGCQSADAGAQASGPQTEENRGAAQKAQQDSAAGETGAAAAGNLQGDDRAEAGTDAAGKMQENGSAEEPAEGQKDLSGDASGKAQRDAAGQTADGQTEIPADPAGEEPAEQTAKTQGDAAWRAAPSVTGALHVDGTRLCGRDGTPVQLRGISTHGLAWFPEYVNEACFAWLHDEWNINVIRLAMYTAEYGGYCTDGDKEQLKQLVRDGVAYARAQDLYAIIDWHILSDGDPMQHLDEATTFFAEMSEEYADAEHVLYEICNEPDGGATWSGIKTYAEQVIEAIRENDKDAVIIVGTPNWSQYVDEAARDPITGCDNLMYALHFYAASHKEELRERLREAVDAGLPVFVTEYGICDASGNGAIDEAEADAWIGLLDSLGISHVAWNLSDKAETSAILLDSCEKTDGFAESDLSESGKWLYHMLTEGQTENR